MRPNFQRLNPVTGARNLLGTHALVETVKSLIKVAVVGAVAASALLPQLTSLGASVGTPPAALGSLLSSSVMGIAQRVAIAYLLIGIADFIYQKRRITKSLKMTKQEVKDEAKNADLPPEVKGQIRKRQIQAFRARMMAAVPQADVVVTNPTHYAVALRYDPDKRAPEVVAKGVDLVAARIREIAREHGVTVVPDPPLARTLHASVEVGHVIPEELYQAVAQLLAFVYRTAAARRAVA
jgi:flagellar biosynthetic protein FlhB